MLLILRRLSVHHPNLYDDSGDGVPQSVVRVLVLVDDDVQPLAPAYVPDVRHVCRCDVLARVMVVPQKPHSIQIPHR